MSKQEWVVHKFGGTSLRDAAHIRRAIGTVEASRAEAGTAVVVSSMAGVTDALLALLALAQARDERYVGQLKQLHQRHRDAIEQLLPSSRRAALLERLESDIRDIGQVLRTTWLLQSYPSTTEAWLVGHGELWSAQMMHAALEEAQGRARWLDAREVLVVEHRETGPAVRWEVTEERLRGWLRQHPCDWLVMTGFIASTPDGLPTTLRRDGSDYSASILGALLEARHLTIWTDVDGVFSANPRQVPEAVLLQHLSWQEATELAYFGAKVLHPHAMAPAIRHNIPIEIRNSARPEQTGTWIHTPAQSEASPAPERSVVKGFATVDGIALINVEGAGMMGVPGIAQRLFGALREVGISVVMISQASSEHSICFAVHQKEEEKTCATIQEAFYREIAQKQIQTVESVSPCSILAAVGDGMVDTPGVAAQFFTALGHAGVNVRAIAQGSSERNISVVVDETDSTRALRAAHAGFYLSDQTLSVGLVGPGLIGGTFLDQLASQAQRLHAEFHIDLRVRGIIDSRRMLLHEGHIPLREWRARLDAEAQPANMDAFLDHIQAAHLPHSAIIDCTASTHAEQWYPNWLQRRLHVITPNKKAFSGPHRLYQELRTLSRQSRAHLFYETTVGAALPVIATLRDLLQTGDRILSVEGVFSGTLSYIFNTLAPGQAFSSIVRQAKEQGYTEPDPRDDLSGMDVARKVSILAREMGLPLEIDTIPVQSLVPAPLRDIDDVETFLARLPEFDGDLQHQLDEAGRAKEVLRYVGAIDPDGSARVELRRYPQTHPFARLRGSDNIVAFRTTRYDTQPIIVQGPGAGPAVTAGGVFADLLRLAARLGAPS